MDIKLLNWIYEICDNIVTKHEINNVIQSFYKAGIIHFNYLNDMNDITLTEIQNIGITNYMIGKKLVNSIKSLNNSPLLLTIDNNTITNFNNCFEKINEKLDKLEGIVRNMINSEFDFNNKKRKYDSNK